MEGGAESGEDLLRARGGRTTRAGRSRRCGGRSRPSGLALVEIDKSHGWVPPAESFLARVQTARRLRKGWVPTGDGLDPPLDPKAPHLYKDASLCLYWPKEWRWTDDESLARTIVAWAALWLHYYEIWQLLGEWTGPSSHDERVGGLR